MPFVNQHGYRLTEPHTAALTLALLHAVQAQSGRPGCQRNSRIPSRSAVITASNRSLAPSFRRRFAMCVRTVNTVTRNLDFVQKLDT